MIHVLASITVKPSEHYAFLEIFKANIPKVLEEEGCVEYSATVDFPTRFVLDALKKFVAPSSKASDFFLFPFKPTQLTHGVMALV